MTDKLLPENINPEGLLVAEAYVGNNFDTNATAVALGMEVAELETFLEKGEVKNIINRRFNEYGFRNKGRFFGLIDQLINMKIDEMEESQIGSSLDIMEILKLQHKFKMDELKAETEMMKAKQATAPTKQTNVQFNNIAGSDDENYMKVLQMLNS